MLSLDAAKNEIQKVSQILLGQPFLQSFRHERESGSLHRGDLRTRDDHLDAEGLTDGDAAGGFVHDQPGVAVSLLGFDGIAKVVGRHFAVGVEDIRQQLSLPPLRAPAKSGPTANPSWPKRWQD